MGQSTPRPAGAVLTIAFGTTVLMWAVAYVCLAPRSVVPLPALLVALAALMTCAGAILARLADPRLIASLRLGLAMTGINFIIVAALNGRDTSTEAVRAGLIWIGGFAAVATVLSCLGAMLARFANARAAVTYDQGAWTHRFALVVALTTLPLIISGGIVTGLEAGLAVPDWLTTFGYPMIFYPLAKMQQDTHVYAEHFHRLWGLLVGLSVITLVVHLHAVRAKGWIRGLAIIVLLAVIVQGVLGGTRVTEKSLTLAIIHGIFAQIVFVTITAIAAFTSPGWNAQPPRESPSIGRPFGWTLPALLLVQLVLGALYRHLQSDPALPQAFVKASLHSHLLMAGIVTVAAIFCAVRAWGRYGHEPIVRRLGKCLLLLLTMQLGLGIAALLMILLRKDAAQASAAEVFFTTAHQATGALLLATAAQLTLWSGRRLRPITSSEQAVSSRLTPAPVGSARSSL